MRVVPGGKNVARDVDVIGYELHPERFEPVRTSYGGDLVPQRRCRRHADAALGDVVGGCGHAVRDGIPMPFNGGISARLLG
jgi:hypothetical protein